MVSIESFYHSNKFCWQFSYSYKFLKCEFKAHKHTFGYVQCCELLMKHQVSLILGSLPSISSVGKKNNSPSLLDKIFR